MSISFSSYCLFCAEECPPTYTIINGDVHKLKHETEEILILENSGTMSTMEEINSIRSNLEVIFILREIIKYPSEKCVPYLSENGGLMHPEHWFTICSACRLCIQECFYIRRKVTQLDKKLVEIKIKLKQLIFCSTKAKAKRTATSARSKTNHQSENIWNDLRNYVLQEQEGDEVRCDEGKITRIKPEAGDPVYENVLVFPDEDHNSCKFDSSRIISPVSPITMPDSGWYPEANEVNVEIGVKVDQSIKKPKIQQRRKKFNMNPTSSLRLKGSKHCTVRKQQTANTILDNTLQDPQKNTQIVKSIIKTKRKTAVADNPNASENKAFDSQDNTHVVTNEIKKEESSLSIDKPTKRPRKACDECPASFQNSTHLAEHKHSVHTKDSGVEFKCPECSKHFDISNKLLHHLNTVHKSKGSDVRWCRDGSGFKKVINKLGIPYYCDHCDIVVINRLRLTTHVKYNHGGRREAACHYCEEKLESKQLLQFHLEMDHPDVPEVVNFIHPKEDETPQSCRHCSESFPTKTKMDYHIAKSHTFTCPECGYVGGGYKELQDHLKTAHDIGEKPLICELCSSRFIHKAGLQYHKQVEHYKELGLTPFICTICDLVAPTEKSLKSHVLKKHEKVKKHFCEFCGKGFSYRVDLMRHLLLHTAPKEEQYKKGPFFCQFCNAKFNVRQGLYYHMKQKHNDTFSFRCDNCGKGYCSSNMLDQHKKSCVNKI